MSRFNTLLFILLISVFCFKEIASTRFINSEYSCCLEDSAEDGQSPEEDGTDKEYSVLFSDIFSHEFKLTLVADNRFRTYTESLFQSPFTEIHLPPPELA